MLIPILFVQNGIYTDWLHDRILKIECMSLDLFHLQSHPEVIKEAKDALNKYGAGLSSVRFICGTQVKADYWKLQTEDN